MSRPHGIRSSPLHLPPSSPGYSVELLCRRTDGQPIQSISPWEVDKVLSTQTSTLNANLIQQGKALNITCTSREHEEHLLKVKSIAGHEVQVTRARKRVQGTIWAPELDTFDDTTTLTEGFASQGVEAVYRPPRGPRALLVLTFTGDRLPPRVLAGYLSYEVRAVKQKPRRCTKCQRYGHLAAKCRSEVVCGNCALNHETKDCQSSKQECAACGGPHKVSSSDCPQWQLEKRVVELMDTESIAPRQARKQAEREFGFQSPTPRRRLAIPPNNERHFPALDTPQHQTATPATPPTITHRNNRPNTLSTSDSSGANSPASSRPSSRQSERSAPSDSESEGSYTADYSRQGARPKVTHLATPTNSAPSTETGDHPLGEDSWQVATRRKHTHTRKQSPSVERRTTNRRRTRGARDTGK